MAFAIECKTEEPSSQDIPNDMTKVKISKNLTVVACGFILLFTAYNGLSMLQSTMNQDQGIGVVSQAITYGSFCVSTLLLPKYMIKKLGCKKCLWMSTAAYIPYIASNFYPHWITMAPSALLVGLAASLLWSSQCTYYNEASVLYSKLCVLSTRQSKNKKLQYCSSNGHSRVERNNSTASGRSQNSVSVGNQNPCTQPADFEMQTRRIPVKTQHNDLKVLNTVNLAVETKKSTEDLYFLKTPSVAPTATEAESNHHAHELKSNVAGNTVSSPLYSQDSPHLYEDAQVSNKLNKLSTEELSKTIESITARFFGLYGLAYCSNHVWSNLMSFYVLQSDSKVSNLTFNSTCACGASFCNVESECSDENIAEPSTEMRYLLTGISVVLGVLAVLILLAFVDDIKTEEEPVTFTFDMLTATCKFLKRKEQMFLIPLTMYIGLSQGFYIGDFTKSYIACAWGAYHVGLVTICYGLASAFSSTLSGWLVKYVGRMPIFVTTALINVATVAYLLLWNPDPHRPFLLFLAATLWGIIVGAFWSQLRAFYGILFKKDEETAFGGFYLWDSIGYCLAFSLSNYVCTYIKLYVLLIASSLGILGYLKVECSYSVGKR